MKQTFLQKMFGIRARREADAKDELTKIVDAIMEGRDDELLPDEVDTVLTALGIDENRLEELVDAERTRRKKVVAVQAGRQAAELHRTLSAEAVAVGEKYRADAAKLREEMKAKLAAIAPRLPAIYAIQVAGEDAARWLLEFQADRRFAGFTRDERADVVQLELSAGSSRVERMKELAADVRHAEAGVAFWKQKHREAVRQPDVDETAEKIRVAGVVLARAKSRYDSAKAHDDDQRAQVQQAENEVLGIAG